MDGKIIAKMMIRYIFRISSYCHYLYDCRVTEYQNDAVPASRTSSWPINVLQGWERAALSSAQKQPNVHFHGGSQIQKHKRLSISECNIIKH
jgi:hypothetical protein